MSRKNGMHRRKEGPPGAAEPQEKPQEKPRNWWRKRKAAVVTGVAFPMIVATFSPVILPVGLSALRAAGVLHSGLPFSWAVTRVDDACQGWLFQKGVNGIPAWSQRDLGGPTQAEMWAARNGGADIGGGTYSVALQGGTPEDVVIEDVRVRVLSKTRAMHGTEIYDGYGCGGGLPSQDFSVDVDTPGLALIPEGGATKWPYAISSGADPEYLVLDAGLKDLEGGFEYSFAYEIDWSQGGQSGTVTVLAPGGRPFTAAPVIPGAPAYGDSGGKWAPLPSPRYPGR